MTSERSLSEDAARLWERASEVALCLDFDGTLAPIVDNPEHSAPLEGIVELLAPLARRYAAVALVSGRPAAFLAERAAAENVRYLGLYGLQESRNGEVSVDPRLQAARIAVRDATDDLRVSEAVLASGAHLEDKQYAIAVHTRRVDDPERWAAPIDAAVREIATRRGLEIVPGKLVWELRPAVHGDKGDAVRLVVLDSGARAVVVVGDDLGDLPAFAAATRLASEGYQVMRVAVRSAETPADLLAQADHIVDGPEGVRELLKLLNG